MAATRSFDDACATCGSRVRRDPEHQHRSRPPPTAMRRGRRVGRRASSRSPAAASSRPAAIRSCSPSGSARRARRRSSSTATTTCSRRATSRRGRRRRSLRSVRDGRLYGRGATDDKGPVVGGAGDPAPVRTSARATAERPFPDRGRGGDRQPEPAGVPREAPRRARRRPRRLGRRRDVAARRAVDRDRGEGPGGARPRSSPARRATCTRDGTAAPSRTRITRSPGSSRACTTPTVRSPSPGFYDDVDELASADREALARVPFDEEAYRPRSGRPRCTASRASRRWSGSGPARRSR